MPSRRSSQPQLVSISTMTFVKVALIVLGIWLLWFLRDIIAIILAAILLAALIEPFSSWLNDRQIPRAFGVLIIYVLLAGLLSLVLFLMVPLIIQQVGGLITNFGSSYGDLAVSYGKFKSYTDEIGLSQNITASFGSIQEALANSFNSLFSTVKGFLGGLAAFGVVLVLAFYMVVEEDVARKFFKSFLPEEYQPYFSQLFNKMHKKIGEWLRGQIILGVVVGVMVYIGLKLLGIEYALLLAVLAGLFEVVPYVGPVVSVIPAAIIGFAMSTWQGVAVVILYVVVQQLENNLLVPKIMQKVTGLNPIISIVALLIGIKVGGLVGAILAIPVATMASVVLEDLFKDSF